MGYPVEYSWVSLVAQLVKNPPRVQETWVRSLGWEGPSEKGMATHSSILAWRIPMGSQRVGHNWATSLSFTFFIERQTGECAGQWFFFLIFIFKIVELINVRIRTVTQYLSAIISTLMLNFWYIESAKKPIQVFPKHQKIMDELFGQPNIWNVFQDDY